MTDRQNEILEYANEMRNGLGNVVIECYIFCIWGIRWKELTNDSYSSFVEFIKNWTGTEDELENNITNYPFVYE